MKKVLTAIALILGIAVSAQRDAGTPQERYIARYASIAVNEMYRTGVPASITLAQGIIESGSGRSRLATDGNNHFGIKCHNTWKGKTMLADDDRKNECFRVYDSAEESFRDHSDFLRYQDRYKFLFDLKTTDYKGWAAGLKKAGYATDPSYASKLIQCVEDYDLGRFDRMTVAQALAVGGADAEAPAGKEEVEEIPESPLKMEAAEIYTGPVKEQFSVSLSRCTAGTAFRSSMPLKERPMLSWRRSIICSSARFCAITTSPAERSSMRARSCIWNPRNPRPSAVWTSIS